MPEPIRNWVTILVLTASVLCAGTVSAETVKPAVDHSAADVVRIVVEALQRNPDTDNDDGIKTVWSFASPGNRAFTGPLERFAAMIKGGFADMLGFQDSRFDAMEVSGRQAVQAVWLRQSDGREVGYLFRLGRQEGGEYDNMWMTEAVLPLGESERSGTSI